MTIRLSTMIGAALLATTALSTAAVAKTTLRLNHNLPETSMAGRVFDTFAERVEELSDGDLAVRVYHNGQLGSQRESIELVQQGALDIAKTNAAEMEAFEPTYSVFNLPYIFSSPEHVMEVLKGEVGQKVLASGAGNGFVGLGLLYDGCRSFYTTKEAKSMGDLKDLKIRVQPSPSAIRMIELMGAQPTPIAFSELYSALQQGVVDGAENSIAALTTSRHGEVAKFYLEDQHACIPAVYVISEDSWSALSDENKEVLQTAAAEALDQSFEVQRADELEQARIFTDEMGGTITPVDKAEFQDAMKPMIDDAIAEGGEKAQLIKDIQALGQ